MSKAVILQHVPYESPGRIIPVLRDFGIPLETRRLWLGDEVPTDLDELRLLIVLGGPMGAADVGTDRHPYLAQELEVLKRLVAVDRPVLGICLGAQLLALAAGAKVYPNVKPGKKPEDPPIPLPELGWGPINLPFPGGTDPVLMGLMDGAMMFHWHFDTFDLPKLPAPANPPPPPAPAPPSGSVLLSSTRNCKNQAFRFKNRLLGFQYHFEFTQEDIEAVTATASPQALSALGPQGMERIGDETARHYRRYARLGERLLQNFVQFLKLY